MIILDKIDIRYALLILSTSIILYSDAQVNVDSLYVGIDHLQTDSEKVSAMNAIAFKYTDKDFFTAEIFVDSALKLSKSINNKRLVSLSYMNMGYVNQKKGNLNLALEIYDSALIIAKQLKDTSAFASIYNNIGNTYRMKGEYDNALVNLYKALEYCKNDTLCMVSKLGNIASVYTSLNEIDKSIEIFLTLCNIFQKRDNKNYLMIAYVNLSNCYILIDSLSKANSYAIKSLNLGISMNNLSVQALSYARIGNIKFRQKKYKNAIENFQKSIDVCNKLDYLEGFIEAYSSLTELYIKIGKYEEAIINAKLELYYAEKIGDIVSIEESYSFLAKLYEKTGNYQKAYNNLLLQKMISDSINNEEKINTITKLQTKYETKEKEQQITVLEKENELKQTEIKQKAQQRNWLTGFFIIILIIAVIIYSYYKKTKAAKNKIETLQREIHHRVKNNLAINRRMVEVAEDKTKDPESRRILRQLETRIASMAEIHEQLYRKKDITCVDFEKYLNDINKNIANTIEMDIPVVNKKFSDEIEIGFDKAVPLGLIINELLTNAYKYAKNEDNPPKVSIDVTKKSDNLKIQVSDNGKGFPKDFDINKIQSYGLKLVSGLTRQLDGTIRFFNSGGANVEIVVPL